MGPNDRQPNDSERQPLLPNHSSRSPGSQHSRIDTTEDGKKIIRFRDDDPGHPRKWPYATKIANIAVIASMAIMSPLASAAFTPAMKSIQKDLDADEAAIIGATTGFVIMLGIGPLVLAPLSETFGRRPLYLVCFSAFALLQIPTALAPNVGTFLAMRALAGFFGSVGIANGGGTISDMFEPGERAGIFGIYLLGPILGPAIGPLMGGVVNEFVSWRWIFWITAIMSGIVVISAFFFLHESYAPAVLAARRKQIEKDEDVAAGAYTFEGEDARPVLRKVGGNIWRPVVILFTQPIVLAMSTYQSVLWSCNYSLYTQFESIWAQEYGFADWQVGLMYLPMGLGLLIGAWFIVPRIDTVYKSLARKHKNDGRPEYRLPLANIGAVTTPVCLFVFAWLVQVHWHWSLIFALVPFGLGQVTIFNCTQNYYIDAFEKYAASAIAAGSLFRSLIGGVVPVLVPTLVDAVGYGWGISVFAFAGVLMAPVPVLFFWYGPYLREKYKIQL